MTQGRHGWPPEDARELRAWHATFWPARRAELTREQLRAGLAALFEQGHCARDVAVMLGLSRQRLFQMCGELRVTSPHGSGSRYRVWDWEAGRFVAVGRSKDYRRARHAVLRAERPARYAARFRAAVAVVRQLAAELGRSPTLREVAERYRQRRFPNGTTALVALRGYVMPGTSYHDFTCALYRAAGLQPRRPGQHGHACRRRRGVLSYPQHVPTPDPGASDAPQQAAG